MIDVLVDAGFPVKVCCRTLGVSSPGYYRYRQRPLAPTKMRREWLTSLIREVHLQSRGTYGSRRVHAELTKGLGVLVSERLVAGTTTDYNWNVYGQLCSIGTSSTPTSTACGTLPSGGTAYQYNGEGLRTAASTATSTTASTWDSTSNSIPLNINDATSNSSGTTNTSYVYGDLLFGGTSPVEQIVTTSSATSVSFLVSSQTGVQGVYNGSGSSLGAVMEMAIYSPYGNQTISSGSKVTPFGFQGSYTDLSGLIYLVNRYYDPSTDEFISIDPDVAETNQPYVFTNDDPLNAEDPLGLEDLGVGFSPAYIGGGGLGSEGPGDIADGDGGGSTQDPSKSGNEGNTSNQKSPPQPAKNFGEPTNPPQPPLKSFRTVILFE